MGPRSRGARVLKISGRIPCYSREIRRFADFLDTHYPLDAELRLVVLADAEILDHKLEHVHPNDENDSKPFYGIYVPTMGIIVVATGLFWPEFASYILVILAHEYCHAIQDMGNKKFDERSADYWANKVVLRYIRGRRGNK